MKKIHIMSSEIGPFKGSYGDAAKNAGEVKRELLRLTLPDSSWNIVPGWATEYSTVQYLLTAVCDVIGRPHPVKGGYKGIIAGFDEDYFARMKLATESTRIRKVLNLYPDRVDDWAKALAAIVMEVVRQEPDKTLVVHCCHSPIIESFLYRLMDHEPWTLDVQLNGLEGITLSLDGQQVTITIDETEIEKTVSLTAITRLLD